MSGYAEYSDNLLDFPRHKVPIIIANNENFKPYGNIVENYEEEKVIIVAWNTSGWRELENNTGIGGGYVEGTFTYKYDDKFLYSTNNAVSCSYITGILNGPKILTREANYHPDGGQIFFPLSNDPFILLLALPGDDIKPTDFIGFYFDGSCGCQIKPNIWHQPAYPLVKEAIFMTKQGAIHGCVCYDSVKEDNIMLEINLDNLVI